MFSFTLSFIFFSYIFLVIARDCQIDIARDFPSKNDQKRAPLLIDPTKMGSDKIYYANNKIVTLKNTERIDFVCSNMTWESRCLDGKFDMDGTAEPFSKFVCVANMQYKAVFDKGVCSNGYEGFTVGFDTKYAFLPLLKGCYDKTDRITKYVEFDMHESVKDKQECSRSLSWKYTDIYAKEPNYSEISRITKQRLGIGVDIGHLGAFTDFPYCQQQIDTYHHVNAVPQCLNCNRGSWVKVEDYIRNKVDNGDREFEKVYAGSYGTMGIGTEIEVPKYLFKLAPGVLDYALVAKNHKTQPEFCKNLCHELPDLKLSPEGKKWIFCCNITDFTDTVDYLTL